MNTKLCQIATNLKPEFPFIVPSQPRNVTVHEVTANSIRISWHAPEKPNGPNLIYRIYYTFLNQTLLAMPKNDPDNGMRSESGIHYYTLRKLSEYATLTQTHTDTDRQTHFKLINIIVFFFFIIINRAIHWIQNCRCSHHNTLRWKCIDTDFSKNWCCRAITTHSKWSLMPKRRHNLC